MKIQYCSDLHLEFPKNRKFILDNPLVPEGDILILAGDIVPFHVMDEHNDFFDYVSEHFEFTYWIAGNHEYYHSDISEKKGEFSEAIRKNVWLVNNTWVNHGNVKIIFSTLWTSIGIKNGWNIQCGLNDFHFIRYGDAKFTTYTYNKLFEENLEFVKKAVEGSTREKCIVVTHHVPTLQKYPSEYKNSPLTDAFAVNLDDFIATSAIDFWIYGHHHRNTPAFNIEGTELITNQLGYVRQDEHKDFSPNETITI